MAFLREKDYFKQIAQTHLEQILQQARNISGDTEIRQVAEVTAIARAKEKLTQRFKVNKIFTDLLSFDISASYKWGDRIDFTAPAYSASTVYNENDLVLYNTGTATQPVNKIYLKNATVATAGTLPTNDTYFTYVGDEAIYYLTPPSDWDEDVTYTANTGLATYKHEYYIRTANIDGYTITGEPKNNQVSLYDTWSDIGFVPSYPSQYQITYPYGNNTTPENPQYWTKILDFTSYLVTGAWPNDSTKWTKGDNRSLTLVKCIIDLSLYIIHGVVNPNQVPKLREDRYKEAEQWLNDCGAGDITPDLPFYTEDPQKGFAIRFGSNPSTSHSY